MTSAILNETEPEPELKIVEDATCTFCGCVCDDITLDGRGRPHHRGQERLRAGQIVVLQPPSHRRPRLPDRGQPGRVEDGVERAARILTDAQYPIIYGLSDTTSEAQRVAVSIGDWIGGCVDTTTSVCHGPSGIAFQDVGEVTCTLGEIKNRGDLIIFWGSNPAESHPRHFTKYSLMPKGHVPAHAAARTGTACWSTCERRRAPGRPICSSRSSPAKISRPCGRCEPSPRASSSTRRSSWKPKPACRLRPFRP